MRTVSSNIAGQDVLRDALFAVFLRKMCVDAGTADDVPEPEEETLAPPPGMENPFETLRGYALRCADEIRALQDS